MYKCEHCLFLKHKNVNLLSYKLFNCIQINIIEGFSLNIMNVYYMIMIYFTQIRLKTKTRPGERRAAIGMKVK